MLSHQHKTIFVHIPKCAGQSVEMAFLKDAGLTWDNRASLLLRANDRPEFGPPRLAHLIAADYVHKNHVPQHVFDAYYKFAIVRDPWARAVSLYRHLNLNMAFRQFVTVWLVDQFANRDAAPSYWFVRPQAEFLMHKDRLIVDDVVRFETLSQDFPAAAKASGLRSKLAHVNHSSEREAAAARAKRSLSKRLRAWMSRDHRDRHPNWRAYYDDATVEAVGNLYAADVKHFDYRFTG